MNTSEFTEAVHARIGNGATKRQVADMVEAVLGTVTDTLKSGDEVRLSSFGIFKVKQTAERQGKNPATGAAITIPAGKKVVFQPAKGLKEAV